MYFCQDVAKTISAAATLPKPLYLIRDHHLLPILGSQRRVGSEGFRWNYGDNFVVVAAGSEVVQASLDGLVDEFRKFS